MDDAHTESLAPAPALRPWSAPQVNTLDVGATRNGPSPNIEETVLTDPSLAPS